MCIIVTAVCLACACWHVWQRSFIIYTRVFGKEPCVRSSSFSGSHAPVSVGMYVLQ